jgi:hypothetical protein
MEYGRMWFENQPQISPISQRYKAGAKASGKEQKRNSDRMNRINRMTAFA